MATAAWRAYVARPGARVYPVITITRSDATQYHFSEVPFAYFQADLSRIGEVSQSFDETGGSVPLPEMEFVHTNAGREFERVLEGPYEMRGAIVQKAYASPDLPSSDWPVEFTGVIATWSYSDDGITVRCRQDDGPIRNSSIPQLPIIKSEWGKVDLGSGILTPPDGVDGIYLPLLYGVFDSAGMGSAGLVPTICVGFNAGTAEYVISLGMVEDVGTYLQLYDLNKAPVAYSYASKAYRGGKTVTVFGFSYLAPVSEDAVFRADLRGYEPVGDGTGTVITNPVAQLRHFLHLVYSGYRTGAWPTSGAPLSTASWDAAEDWATLFGLEGAAYIGGGTSTETARDIVDRWLNSFPCFRLWWNSVGELEILIWDPTVWPGYPDASARRVSTIDFKKGSYRREGDDEKLVRRISSTLRFSPADGTSFASVDVVDMLQTEKASLSLRMDWASAPAVDVTRQIASRQLRVFRKPRWTHYGTLPFQYADLKPGDTLYLDGGQVPSSDGDGRSRRGWDTVALLVRRVAKRPSAKEVEIEAIEAREMQVTFWTPGCTDLGASDEDNGLAMIHQGTPPACTRAQLGFRRRPGDQSYRDSLSNVWRVSPWGISVCGGSGAAADGVLTWQPKNNTFSQGTPPVYTDWSSSGTIYTGLADGEYLIDATGYRQSAWPFEDAYLYNTSAVAVTNGRKVRVYFVWADFVGEPKLRLEDTAAGKWYDFAAGTWGASTAWQTPANVVTGGGSFKLHDWHYELWSAEIVCDAHASPTLKVYVGNNTTATGTAYIICAAGFVVPDTNTGAGARPIRRSLLATTSSALAQAADIISVDNPTASPILDPTGGTVQVALVPYWDLADLDDNAEKVLWRLVTDAAYGGGAAYFECVLKRIDASTLRAVFRAAQGGATIAETYVAGAVAEFMGDLIRVGCRWTGPAGEYDLAPYTLDVFLDATKGTAATCSSTPASLAAGSKLYLGSRGTGTAAHAFADGELSHVETRLFPLDDEELARGLTSLTLPARPTDA